MPSIGLPEVLIVLFVALLILGPKRLPGLGRQLGGGLREFKSGITGSDAEDPDPAHERAALAAAPGDTPVPGATAAHAPVDGSSVHDRS